MWLYLIFTTIKGQLMEKLFSRLASAWLLLSILTLPVSALASGLGTYSSTLTNDSGHGDTDYTLEIMATWGDDCIIDSGKPVLAPGETSVLKISRECEWAGIKYKALKHNTLVGYVTHSFRDGKFAIEVSLACHDGDCAFTGLPPKSFS
jgi:hypothetical protein